MTPAPGSRAAGTAPTHVLTAGDPGRRAFADAGLMPIEDTRQLPRFQSLKYYLDNCKPFVSCLLWQGCKDKGGYGKVHYMNKTWRLHRLIYTFVYGDIEDGWVVHHLCGNRDCINPDHLYAMRDEEHRRVH